MSSLGEPDRDVDAADDRHPKRRRRTQAYRRSRLAAGLAMLAALAAVPAQPVLSNVPDSSTAQSSGEPVDPDCLPPEQAVESLEERDGVCPSEEGSEGPTSPPDPGPPADPKPPTRPPAPTGGGGAPKSDNPAGDVPVRSVSGDDDRGNRRVSPRKRGRGKGRRRDGGRIERPRRARGRKKESRRDRRRASKHMRERHKRRGSRPREPQPMPRWTRSLVSQPLPDPLPAGKRLDMGFAALLAQVAKRNRVSWPLLLAVLRARGHDGSTPAQPAEVRKRARELAALGAQANPRRAIRALAGEREPAAEIIAGAGRRVTFVDRVLALAGYHRAVGLVGLVRGLDVVKAHLIERVLASDRILIYPGGRSDVKAGQVDGRVLVLMLYLAHRHGTVTVSSLKSGHGFFTKSGNVSNHSYGRAVDIAALGGVPIMGHQEPGGVTERALQNILLLPEELWPSELISLFAMGGPSFFMADHADHIHAGFGA